MENPADPDLELYRQAEARWLREYRDTKRLVPVRVPTAMPAAGARERRLNLGCDTYRLPGFVNVDLRCEGQVRPEVRADVGRLPFADEEFDFIYAGHLLEHLYYDCVPAYLGEWRRVLRRGGTLAIVVPDVGTGMRRYAAGAYSLDHVLPQIFGQYYSWDYGPQRHQYAYDYPRLVDSVSRVPWTTVGRLDFRNAPAAIAPHIGRVISDADWQMGVVLTK
jgi:predicted SAM-dependent methyltransferase